MVGSTMLIFSVCFPAVLPGQDLAAEVVVKMHQPLVGLASVVGSTHSKGTQQGAVHISFELNAPVPF